MFEASHSCVNNNIPRILQVEHKPEDGRNKDSYTHFIFCVFCKFSPAYWSVSAMSKNDLAH